MGAMRYAAVDAGEGGLVLKPLGIRGTPRSKKSVTDLCRQRGVPTLARNYGQRNVAIVTLHGEAHGTKNSLVAEKGAVKTEYNLKIA